MALTAGFMATPAFPPLLQYPEGDELLETVCQEIFATANPDFNKQKRADMVIWDNWRMLHSVSGHSPDYARHMQRTTIKNDAAIQATTLNEARTMQFPVFGKNDLDEKQRALWDELTLGPRGFYTGGREAKRLPDLYNAWLQFPEFGQLLLRLGDEVRAHTELSGKYRELVVLTTSALLGARVEYDFHIPFAQNEGLPESVISAIGEGGVPVFADKGEQIIYEANVQFLQSATLTERTREEVIALIGLPGLVQLIAAISLYIITAYTTNVARVKLAKDFSADPTVLKNFFAGRRSDDSR